MLSKFAKKSEDTMYTIFRVVIGIVYGLHGMWKLGWLGNTPLTGFMFFIGICEVLIALAIVLGFLTRIAAIGGVIIMIGAQATAHIFKKGVFNSINPLANGGEASLLFLAAFLLIFAYGASKHWSLEKAVFKKEVC
jgi:uncharacterized membrane protein YphA (DoxX/SURF4 family)